MEKEARAASAFAPGTCPAAAADALPCLTAYSSGSVAPACHNSLQMAALARCLGLLPALIGDPKPPAEPSTLPALRPCTTPASAAKQSPSTIPAASCLDSDCPGSAQHSASISFAAASFTFPLRCCSSRSAARWVPLASATATSLGASASSSHASEQIASSVPSGASGWPSSASS